MRHGKVDKKLIKGILELRRRIEKAKIPPSILDESINIATWNIREFGKRRREKASIHYIAEILYQFDLIAITELRDNMKDLKRVMELLGSYWQVVYSDFVPDRAGNKERIAYLFDKRAVAFTGLAAEADPPRKKDKKSGKYLEENTWWRSPYMASFKAGSFDFILLTTHIRWGSGSKKQSEGDRENALKHLAEWVDKRIKEKNLKEKDIILMGDFNIPKTGNHPLYKAITSKGLKMPKALEGVHGTNLTKNNNYDQILHYPKYTKCFSERGGVIDFYQKNFKKLYPKIKKKHDFTFQLSDHLPLWIQVKTDIDDEVLK